MSIGPAAGTPTPADDVERRIGRLLTVLTYVAVALLAVGVALMAAAGIDPRATPPAPDPAGLVGDLLALRPDAFLWLGLVAVIAAPVSRVVVAGVGYARRGDRRMAVIAAAVVIVLVVAVGAALASEA
jgi:uncharacterized membrane protein